ncbi:hypothetical protein VTI74DRAFT_6571 [Chaetomium olivicolor]
MAPENKGRLMFLTDAAVLSQEQADELWAWPELPEFKDLETRLDFVVVSDIAGKCYKKSESMQQWDAYYRPALGGTHEILNTASNAASDAGTVHCVVLTSPLCITPWDHIGAVPVKHWETDIEAYATGKAAAQNLIDTRKGRHGVGGFDIVHLYPGFVIGTPTDRPAVRAWRQDGPCAGVSAHFEDVAPAKVVALDKTQVRGDLGSSSGRRWYGTT